LGKIKLIAESSFHENFFLIR